MNEVGGGRSKEMIKWEEMEARTRRAGVCFLSSPVKERDETER